MSEQSVIERQNAIASGTANDTELPKNRIYAICNLRGGIGKTTLSFNLSYLTDNLLAVDTCPQGNLSFFFDNNYYSSQQTNVNDILLPYLVPGLGKASHAASFIGATNKYFYGKRSYFIPSSEKLYLLPSQLNTAINLASSLPLEHRIHALKSILYSLKVEIEREIAENDLDKCLIDTSPFFSGCTQLSWYAADALVVPVRTDQQSVKSLELLVNTLTSPQGEFRKYLDVQDTHTPKIQMVVLTHCGWSTVAGARNRPNQQTMMYIKKVYDILSKYRSLLTTDDPDNHLFLLDDFLGSGRISSIESKPIELMNPGDTKTIERTRTVVNQSVTKCKNQLKYISRQLW